MSIRKQFRTMGNAALQWMPRNLRRKLLKGFSDQPELAEECGFQVMPRVFYSPAPLLDEIARERLLEERPLPGIDLRLPSALSLVETLARHYSPEIAEIPRERTPGMLMWMENASYQDFDTATLYGVLRHLKPRRYVEVGCGYSSRTSTLALRKNAAEGTACEALYIEPYPAPHLLEIESELSGPLLRRRIQDVPLETFTGLQSGDVLFIDTSHVIRTQNDVEHELLRVLPSLAPGVWVHIHDIFTPYDYPEEWVFSVPRAGNNEQYALECLLSGGDRFQVELPVYCLWRRHRAALDRLCSHTTDRPAAFWIQRTGTPA